MSLIYLLTGKKKFGVTQGGCELIYKGKTVIVYSSICEFIYKAKLEEGKEIDYITVYRRKPKNIEYTTLYYCGHNDSQYKYSTSYHYVFKFCREEFEKHLFGCPAVFYFTINFVQT